MRSSRAVVGAVALALPACSNEYETLALAQSGSGGGPTGTGAIGGAGAAPGVGGGVAGSGGSGGSAVSTSSSASSSSSSAGGSGPGTVEYVATVAACISYDAPNPDVCEAQVQPNEILVDTDEGNTNDPMGAFIRFDLDGALAGKTIAAVRLRVRVTGYSLGNSQDTGEVFEVVPFVLPDLYATVPPTIGAALAPDRGPVAHFDVVEFDLPTTLVAPSSGVYLSISPVSTDLVSYYNHETPDAPRLIVDYQ